MIWCTVKACSDIGIRDNLGSLKRRWGSRLSHRRAGAWVDPPGSTVSSRLMKTFQRWEIQYQIKDHSDHETAAGADSDILLVAKVVQSNLEAIATGTRVVVELESLIEGHVFDLNLIVDGQILVVGHDDVCRRVSCKREYTRGSVGATAFVKLSQVR